MLTCAQAQLIKMQTCKNKHVYDIKIDNDHVQKRPETATYMLITVEPLGALGRSSQQLIRGATLGGPVQRRLAAVWRKLVAVMLMTLVAVMLLVVMMAPPRQRSYTGTKFNARANTATKQQNESMTISWLSCVCEFLVSLW